MRKGIRTMAALAASTLVITGLTACAEDTPPTTGEKKPKVGVILPDSGQSSVRWETADRRYLEAAFDAAGVEYDIRNAENDAQEFINLGDQLIASGIDVLLIVNLDSGSGKAVLEKAKQAGIGTIDYDRLTLGGGADYYVSFDNVAVGRLQGEGLVKCLTDNPPANPKPRIIHLNGSPTDNNATLFAEGYNGVLNPKYTAGAYEKVGDQSVPGWDNAQAQTIFEGLFQTAGGQVDGVLAANDGLGNAAINVLKANGLKVPVTGQDATVQGLQNVLSGDQCMTVYKAVKQEADGAAALAIALAKGETITGLDNVTDTETNKQVPSKLLVPVAIYKNNVKSVVDDGYVKASDLCAGDYAAICTELGIA